MLVTHHVSLKNSFYQENHYFFVNEMAIWETTPPQPIHPEPIPPEVVPPEEMPPVVIPLK